MIDCASRASPSLVGVDRLLPYYPTAKEYLGVPRETARRFVSTGQVATIKLGRELFVRESAFRGLMASLQPKQEAA